MLATPMSTESTIESAVRRELLQLALRNAKRSIPLQLLAVGFVVYLGVHVSATGTAVLAGLLGLLVAVWRHFLVRRFAAAYQLSEQRLTRATRELEANSALTGILWALSTFNIYPSLQEGFGTTYVMILFGSLATAAFFMSLVGQAFGILAGLQLGALVAVSLFNAEVRSVSQAVLAAFFGITMYRAASEVHATTTRAILHSREAELANASLLQAKAAAEAANLAKSQFLATMSHEIRTPMNGVLGALDLLRHSKLEPGQRRLVRTAASSGFALMGILNDVLDHSKIEAGKLELVCAPLSAPAVAATVVALFRANAEKKGLPLALDIDPECAEWVLGDAQRLKQVLLNLVGNAIKFTERGAVSLRVSPGAAAPGWAGLVFEVHDSGVGMTAAATQSLFQPFHQLEVQRNQRLGGTGLGLAISQRIVEAMGGRIEVESEPGIGSCFRFALQFELDPTEIHAAAVDSGLMGLDEPASLEGVVLVVEDNEVNRMIAREMLASLGLRVIEAGDGAHALDQLEQHNVDLVLMDCHMPVLDGYGATREIRRLEEQRQPRARVPVLALTADAFQEDIVRMRDAGMDGHLAKPYTRDQLSKLLGTWL